MNPTPHSEFQESPTFFFTTVNFCVLISRIKLEALAIPVCITNLLENEVGISTLHCLCQKHRARYEPRDRPCDSCIILFKIKSFNRHDMKGFSIPAPDYKLQETNSEVILTVNVPLCKPDEIHVLLEKKLITFEAHPYFFKFKLPCKVKDENTEEQFDENTGIYVLKLRKDTDNGTESHSESDNNLTELITCKTNKQSDKQENPCSVSYGFLNIYSGRFGHYFSEFSEVVDLPDPDGTKTEERTILREKEEKEKWDEDQYLADLMDNEDIKPLFKYKPPWYKVQSRDLSKEEEEILNSIPKCECFASELSDSEMSMGELQLVDVLLGYCYNKRTTEGDNTVESAWTINKLSSSLSWFEVFKDLKSVILCFYRRSLTYPLYRNWKLTKTIQGDVIDLLKSGTNEVTRCLIETKELFDESENRYILNTLYVGPLCHFSRLLDHKRLNELAGEIRKIKILKQEVVEDLVLLEIGAKLALEEEEGKKGKSENIMDEICELLSAADLEDEGDTSSDSEDEDSSTSATDSDATSSDSD